MKSLLFGKMSKNIKEKIWLIIEIVWELLMLVASAAFAVHYFDILICIVLLLVEGAFVFLNFKTRFIYEKLNYCGLFLSLIISALFAYNNMNWASNVNVFVSSIKILDIIAIFLIFVFAISFLFALIIDFKGLVLEKGLLKDRIMIPLATTFYLFFFCPIKDYINNYQDYSGIVFDYLGIYGSVFIGVFFFSLYMFLKFDKESLKNIQVVYFYVLVATYIQVMFLNGHIGSIDGGRYVCQTKWGIIDGIIWLIVLGGVAYIYKVKASLWDKISKVVSTLLFFDLLVILIFLIIGADYNVFVRLKYVENCERQFEVAKENNTIIFVFDAVDNKYLSQIYSENPELFEGALKDFTLYTNTCSVYDCTNRSMRQMFVGDGPDYQIADYDLFYNRLHENDYMINYYTYDSTSSVLDEYLDNYVMVDADEDSVTISYLEILLNSGTVSLFQMLPDYGKNYIDTSRVDFSHLIRCEAYADFAVYANQEFYNKLNLRVCNSEGVSNALIVQHLAGTHQPCADFIQETKVCLNVVEKYIEQLEALGLYDNATIIITSDHGEHDDDPRLGVYASTPIFMIHSPGDSFDGVEFNDAPIYHTDFLKTILVNASLYDEADGDCFGFSIYDFSEGDLRQRTWFNRDDIGRYDYIGDTSELERVVLELNPR